MSVPTNCVIFYFYFKRNVPVDKFGIDASEIPDALALAMCTGLHA